MPSHRRTQASEREGDITLQAYMLKRLETRQDEDRSFEVCARKPIREESTGKGRLGDRPAHAFFGVAFLGVVFFVVAFAAAAFLGAAFFGAALDAAGSGALVLVTRPDFVFPRTRVTSFSTAGAGAGAAAVADLRGLLALALGLAAVVGFLTVVAFAVVAFLVAGAFLVVVAFAFCYKC